MAGPAPTGAGPAQAAGAAALAAWDGAMPPDTPLPVADVPAHALLAVHVACAQAYACYHGQWGGICLEDVLGDEPWALDPAVQQAALALLAALRPYAPQ
jgi:hypothetical protein